MSTKKYSLPDEVVTFTDNFKEFDSRYQISIEQRNLMPELLADIDFEDVIAAINTLEQLFQDYPENVLYKSMLALNYLSNKNYNKAFQLASEILAVYPDFLDAKRCLAGYYNAHGDTEKTFELFGKFSGCMLLFPDRKSITYSEYYAYISAAVEYSIAINDEFGAQVFLDNLLEIPQLEFLSFQLQEQIDATFEPSFPPPLFEVTTTAPVPVTIKSTPPNFQHAETQQFYTLGLEMENRKIRELLSLPRESFAADLQLMLSDLLERFSYLSNSSSPNNRFMMYHAMAFLAAIEAEDKVPFLLNFLKNNTAFINYWTYPGESLELLPVFTVLGKNKIEQYEKFLFEPGIDSEVKTMIVSALFQIAQQYPYKYTELLGAYNRIFVKLNSNFDITNVFDDDLLLTMCEDALELDNENLALEVKLFFYNKQFNGIFPCTFEDMLTDAIEESRRDNKLELKNIYQFYTQAAELAFDDEIFESLLDVSPDDEMEEINSEDSLFTNIGRNALCPCGSGKKFKRCHGGLPEIGSN